jgi:uncharacterized protein (TIGR03546 family)
MIKTVANILKILNSESDPSQISLALCLAMFAGFTPFVSIHNLVVIFLVLILRVNLSTFLLGLAAFSALAYLLDPLFHRIGLALLTADSFQGFWTTLYNSSFWRLTRFNNSILMGSFIFSLLLFLPLYFLLNLAVENYREHFLSWVRKSRVMQALTASKFYSMYQSASGWWR